MADWFADFLLDITTLLAELETHLPGAGSSVGEILLGKVPEADAETLYRLAEAWGDAAEALAQAYGEAATAANGILENWSGDGAAAEFVRHWGGYLQGVYATVEALYAMQEGVNGFALQVELMKFMVALNLIMFVVAIIAIVVSLVPSCGLSAGGLGAAAGALRAGVGGAFTAVIRAIGQLTLQTALRNLTVFLVRTAPRALPRAATTAGRTLSVLGRQTLPALTHAAPTLIRSGAPVLIRRVPTVLARTGTGLARQTLPRNVIARSTAERMATQWARQIVGREAGARGVVRRVLGRQIASGLGREIGAGGLTRAGSAALRNQLARELEQNLARQFGARVAGRAVTSGLGRLSSDAAVTQVTRSALSQYAARQAAQASFGRELAHYVGVRMGLGAGILGGGNLFGQFLQVADGHRAVGDVNYGEATVSGVQGALFGAGMWGGPVGHVLGGGLAGGTFAAGQQLWGAAQDGTLGLDTVTSGQFWGAVGSGAGHGAAAGVLFGTMNHVQSMNVHLPLRVGQEVGAMPGSHGSLRFMAADAGTGSGAGVSSGVRFGVEPGRGAVYERLGPGGLRELGVLDRNGQVVFRQTTGGPPALHAPTAGTPRPPTFTTSPAIDGPSGGPPGGHRDPLPPGEGPLPRPHPQGLPETPSARPVPATETAGPRVVERAPAVDNSAPRPLSSERPPPPGDRPLSTGTDRPPPNSDRPLPSGDRPAAPVTRTETPTAPRPEDGAALRGSDGTPTRTLDTPGETPRPRGAEPHITPSEGPLSRPDPHVTPSDPAPEHPATGAEPAHHPLASAGAEAGEPPTPQSIEHGTVRMEDHPDFPATVEWLNDLGYTLVPSDSAPRVVVRYVYDSSRELAAIEHEVKGRPGMRWLDLEHELDHVRQITDPARFPEGPLPTEITGKPKIAPPELTAWHNATLEYHVRLGEYLRLAERGVDPAVLAKHALGVEEWRGEFEEQVYQSGSKRKRIPWVKQRFPDIPGLAARFDEVRAAQAEPPSGPARPAPVGDHPGTGFLQKSDGDGGGAPAPRPPSDEGPGEHVPSPVVPVEPVAVGRTVELTDTVASAVDRHVAGLIDGTSVLTPDLPHRATWNPDSHTLTVRYGDGLVVDVTMQVNPSLLPGHPVVVRPSLVAVDGGWVQAEPARVALPSHVPTDPMLRDAAIDQQLTNSWRQLHAELNGTPPLHAVDATVPPRSEPADLIPLERPVATDVPMLGPEQITHLDAAPTPMAEPRPLTPDWVQDTVAAPRTPEPVARWAQQHLMEAGEDGVLRPKTATEIDATAARFADEAAQGVAERARYNWSDIRPGRTGEDLHLWGRKHGDGDTAGLREDPGGHTGGRVRLRVPDDGPPPGDPEGVIHGEAPGRQPRPQLHGGVREGRAPVPAHPDLAGEGHVRGVADEAAPDVEQHRSGATIDTETLRGLEDEAYAVEGPAHERFQARFEGWDSVGEVHGRGGVRSTEEGVDPGGRPTAGGVGVGRDDPPGPGDRRGDHDSGRRPDRAAAGQPEPGQPDHLFRQSHPSRAGGGPDRPVDRPSTAGHQADGVRLRGSDSAPTRAVDGPVETPRPRGAEASAMPSEGSPPRSEPPTTRPPDSPATHPATHGEPAHHPPASAGAEAGGSAGAEARDQSLIDHARTTTNPTAAKGLAKALADQGIRPEMRDRIRTEVGEALVVADRGQLDGLGGVLGALGNARGDHDMHNALAELRAAMRTLDAGAQEPGGQVHIGVTADRAAALGFDILPVSEADLLYRGADGRVHLDEVKGTATALRNKSESAQLDRLRAWATAAPGRVAEVRIDTDQAWTQILGETRGGDMALDLVIDSGLSLWIGERHFTSEQLRQLKQLVEHDMAESKVGSMASVDAGKAEMTFGEYFALVPTLDHLQARAGLLPGSQPRSDAVTARGSLISRTADVEGRGTSGRGTQDVAGTPGEGGDPVAGAGDVGDTGGSVREVRFVVDEPDLVRYDPANPRSHELAYARPQDVAGRPLPLFEGPPRRDQVAQGALGDCGIVATIGAVAGHRPEVITRAVTQNADGTVTVTVHEVAQDPGAERFRPTGRVYQINVTPDVPVLASWRTMEFGMRQSAVGCSWASLLEKAVAGLDSQWTPERRLRDHTGTCGYERLNGGASAYQWAELLAQLTGETSVVYRLDPAHGGEAVAEAQLRAQLQEGKPVVVSIPSASVENPPELEPGLHYNHAYEVVWADHGLVGLRNPWNQEHPAPVPVRRFLDVFSPDFATLER